ncbi:MAG: porin family protein [Pseudomonadales bacterium]|nr:porin family protein [Pseudomonadales bacterium]
MKRILLPALLALHAPVLADPVYQQDGYFGIQYNMLTQETDGDDLEPSAFQTRFGVQFNPYVAVEGRLGYGLSDDDLSGGGATLTLDPEWLVGAYLKVGVDKSLPVAPYVLLGHSTATAEVTSEVSTLLGSAKSREERTASDPSYGAGVEVNLSDSAALNAEWVLLDDDDGFDLSTINVGFLHRF